MPSVNRTDLQPAHAASLVPTRVVGHGPTLVIVSHGWMGDHRLFDPFITTIDQDRYTYAFVDCRGYGTRQGEPGPMSVEAMAEDVLAVAESLGWERFHVIGHSMGGMAAQRLMVDTPDRLESAILVAPVPASGARIDDERRALLRRAMALPEARRELIDANTGRIRNDAWLDHLLNLSLGSTNAAALEAYMASWTGTDFAAEARGATVPVLLIVGELDPGAPLARMQETIMSWYPRAQLRQMKGIGHYPMQESPDELATLLDAHFAALSARD